MTAYVTQLHAGRQIVPLTREPDAVESIITQFRAAAISGELRIVDEQTGSVILRIPLDDAPEEGDWHQPWPAA